MTICSGALVEPGGDGGVVQGGTAKDGERELAAGVERNLALCLELCQDLLVGLGGGDDHDRPEILRRCAEHRGAADVYLLYGLLLRGSARHRLLEGVEVYADEVYGAYAVLDELGDVVGVLKVREDAAVDLRVEGLHPAAQDLGLARD